MTIDDLPKEEREVVKLAINAIKLGITLPVLYDGTLRLVEVHAVGVTTKGNAAMRVFQIAGETHSGEELGWKLMTLDKVSFVYQKSQAPREGFKPGDKGLGTIFAEVKT